MTSFTRRPSTRGIASLLTLIVAVSVAASIAALPGAARAEVSPKTEDEKAFYSIGTGLSQQFQSLSPISDSELEVLVQGLRDGIRGKTLAVDQQEGANLVRTMVQKRQGAAAEAEKEASTAFAAAEAGKPGAKKTESGLVYTEIRAGSGASPNATDKVRVHYHGTLRDGTVFDSSVDRGEPAEFPLNRVIPCWTEGVAMMKPGGKSRLVCPAEIAYGDRSTGRIPGGATLIFEVELLEILE
jgi:FKBP-type peptidyl-prolyl cis-trans isomerase FkpA